jgi:hypothetical protein
MRSRHSTASAAAIALLLLSVLVVRATRADDTPAARAATWRDHVSLTLSDRVRGEFVDWFKPAASAGAASGAQRYDFFANQLRVGFRVAVPHVRVTAELQDTRIVNLPDDASLPPPVGNLGPGAIYFANTHDRDQGEPFLKQGHLTVVDVTGAPGLAATIGRFEYSDALETVPADSALAWVKRTRLAERLVGSFGYTHVTRSFDGGRVAIDRQAWNVTAIGVRPTHGGFEVSANRELTEVALAGAALTWKEIPGAPPVDLRLFYLYYEDARNNAVKVDNRPIAVRRADHKDIAVHSWGGHAASVAPLGPGKIDGLLWVVGQQGRWGDLDHGAWAYAVEAGYQLPQAPAAPWMRVGFDRSSGDGDPSDDRHRSFFQVLPTARMYAQFPFYNLMNNQDLFAQLILKPHPRVSVRTDYHWLSLTERQDLWYAGGGATNAEIFGFSGIPSGGDHDLAHLVDVGVTVTPVEHVTAYAYYGHAFGQSVVQSTFAGAGANYGYVEVTYRY